MVPEWLSKGGGKINSSSGVIQQANSARHGRHLVSSLSQWIKEKREIDMALISRLHKAEGIRLEDARYKLQVLVWWMNGEALIHQVAKHWQVRQENLTMTRNLWFIYYWGLRLRLGLFVSREIRLARYFYPDFQVPHIPPKPSNLSGLCSEDYWTNTRWFSPVLLLFTWSISSFFHCILSQRRLFPHGNRIATFTICSLSRIHLL